MSEVAASRPYSPQALNDLGASLAGRGRTDDAIACYRRALALDPDFALALYNLGLALRRRGQLDEALAALRRAVALRPGDADVGSALAAALVEGSHGILGKLIALPEFILVVALARLVGTALRRVGAPVLPILLSTKVVLLAAFFALAVIFGPFANPDSPAALLTGFAGIAAMAPFTRLFANTLGTGRWYDTYIPNLVPVGGTIPQLTQGAPSLPELLSAAGTGGGGR